MSRLTRASLRVATQVSHASGDVAQLCRKTCRGMYHGHKRINGFVTFSYAYEILILRLSLGPRDPTNSPSFGSPAAKLSNQGGVNSPSSNYTATRAKSSSDPDRISVLHATTSRSREGNGRSRVLSFTGVKEHSHGTSPYKHCKPENLIHRSGHHLQDSDEKDDEKETELADSDQPYYLNRYTTGRNAQFHDLTRAEREHLGGVEYRALTFLSILVPVYWILWQLLGCIGLAAYFAHNNARFPLENGINPWYVFVRSNRDDI